MTDGEFVEKLLLRKLQKEKIFQIRDKKEKETEICKFLFQALSKAASIISYKSIGFEVDLNECMSSLCEKIKIYYPRIKGEKLEFVEALAWKIGEFSIPEPVGEATILPEFSDYCVIPSLGYNQRGFRLGRGGGFYDKTLENLPSEKIIGVSFSEAFPVDFEEESHDIKVGKLITEKETFFFGNSEIPKADNINGLGT